MGCLVSGEADRHASVSSNLVQPDSQRRNHQPPHHRTWISDGQKSSRDDDAHWWRRQKKERRRRASTSPEASLGDAHLLPSKKRRHTVSPCATANKKREEPMERTKSVVSVTPHQSSIDGRSAAPAGALNHRPKRSTQTEKDEVDNHDGHDRQNIVQQQQPAPPSDGQPNTRSKKNALSGDPDEPKQEAHREPGGAVNPLSGPPKGAPRHDRNLTTAEENAVHNYVRSESRDEDDSENATVMGGGGGGGGAGIPLQLPTALLNDAFGPQAAQRSSSSLSTATQGEQARSTPRLTARVHGHNRTAAHHDIGEQYSNSGSGTVRSVSLAELVAQQMGSSSRSSSSSSSQQQQERHVPPAVGVASDAPGTFLFTAGVVLLSSQPAEEEKGRSTLMTDLTFSAPRARSDQFQTRPVPSAAFVSLPGTSTNDAKPIPTTMFLPGAAVISSFETGYSHPTSTEVLSSPCVDAKATRRKKEDTDAALHLPVTVLPELSRHSSSGSSTTVMSDLRVVGSAVSHFGTSGAVPADNWALLNQLRERDVLKRLQMPLGSLARLDAVIVRCLRKWCVLWRVADGASAALVLNGGVHTKTLSKTAVEPALFQPQAEYPVEAETSSTPTTTSPAKTEAELVLLLRDLWTFVSLRQDPRASLLYPDVLKDPLVHNLMASVDANTRARALLDAYQESRRELLHRRGSMSSDSYRHVPDEVLPGMFVGSYHAVMSPGILSQLNIRAVVSCVGNLFPDRESVRNDESGESPTARPKDRVQRIRDERHWEQSTQLLHSPLEPHDDDEESNDVPTFSVRDGVHYLFLEMRDKTSYRVDAHFEVAIRFLRSRYFDHRENILVLCGAGVSRAPTVMAAFLCDVFVLPVDLSLDIIRQSRSSIRPNEAFLLHLIRWYSPEMLERTTTTNFASAGQGDLLSSKY